MRGRCSAMSTRRRRRPARDRQPRRGRQARTRRAGRSCGAKSAALALHLKAMGIKPGDRVAAYLPNIPETIVAFLASASIGAVWCVCAPDMARARRARPLQADRAEGADRLRRRHLCRRAGTIASDVVARAAADAADGRSTSSCTATRAAPAAPDALLSDFVAARAPTIDAVRAGLAAVRSSALDRLFQRHDRPAEGDRARPWRHHLEVLKLLGLHNDLGAAPVELVRRPLSLVQLDRLDHVELAGRRPARRHHLCIFDGSPGGTKDKPDWTTLWRFVGAAERDLLRRRRGVLRQLPEGRRSSRCAPATCRALRASARPARRSADRSANDWLRERCRRSTAAGEADIWLDADLRRHRFRRRLHRRHCELAG